MKLSPDMLFAHPVLSPTSDDYVEGAFEAEFEVTIGDGANIDISASIALTCPELQDLLRARVAACGFFLICRSTYENRLIEMPPGSGSFRFRAGDFFGTVQLRPVVWSTRAQHGWRSNQLHPEYGGVADLPAAAILAMGEEFKFTVDRERLRPLESIFSLAASDELALGEFAVDLDGDKITIRAHPQTKGALEDIRNNVHGRNVLLNAVYLPAVMQVLAEVADDRGRCEDRPWFRVFEAKAVARGVNLESPEYLRDAQRLLGSPFLKIERERERIFA